MNLVKKNSIIFSAILMMCCSTKSDKDSKNLNCELIEIDVTDTVSEFDISNIVESINYIPLLADDSSLLGEVVKIEKAGENYYVSDYNSIFCFNSKGEIVFKIQNIGEGPGEYIRLINFTIDKKNEIIYAISDHKWISYNLTTGDFLKEEKVFLPIMKIENISENIFFIDGAYHTHDIVMGKNKPYSFYTTNDEGEILDKFFGYNKSITSYIKFYNRGDNFYKNNHNELLFNPLLTNKAYRLKENKSPECVCEIDYGKKKLPNDILNTTKIVNYLNRKEEYAILSDFIETENNLIFYTEYAGSGTITCYDKKLKKLHTFNFGSLKNDINNLEVTHFDFSNSDELIYIIYPESIVDRSPFLDIFSKNEIENINKYNNPILAICKPK